jgi:hypothetical protein
MGKTKHPRKKKKSENRAANSGVHWTFQYYQILFQGLHEDASEAIDRATTNVSDTRDEYWQSVSHPNDISGDDGWNRLNAYLSHIESRIQHIVQQHTHYFWLHLYRRIGIGLHPDLNKARDARTISLVRGILEAAFVRYASLDATKQDIRQTSDINVAQIAGGYFHRYIEKHREARPSDGRMLDKLVADLMASNQWVLADFTINDFVDVFHLEALSYEYWLTTARMRRVGKGGALLVSPFDEVARGDQSDELGALFQSYDRRTDKVPFAMSAIGVAFYPNGVDNDLRGFAASYNSNQLAWSKACPFKEVKVQDFVPNFIYGTLQLGAYARAHGPFDEAFRAERGFSLHSFCGVIAAVAAFAFRNTLGKRTDQEKINGLIQLYQRAYQTSEKKSYSESLKIMSIALMDKWMGVGGHDIVNEFEQAFEFLSLTAQKQRGSGLWSLGPRYAFIDHGSGLIIDLQGLPTVLMNAYFGIKYFPGKKGALFEDEFRARAASVGLDVLPHRSLKIATKTFREVDAAIRVGDTLFLCECRAMEKPLDLEISRPKSVRIRINELDIKVKQANSLALEVETSRLGLNYDFQWATKVVPLVVSPFVEWIWATGPELWIDEHTPRILSVEEAVVFMKASATRAD